MSTKDFQRQKVYDAEYAAFKGSPKLSENKIKLFYSSVISSDYINDYYSRTPRPNIDFWDRKYSSITPKLMMISREDMTEETVLHELAHILGCRKIMPPLHGKSFCSRLLELVDVFLGKEDYEKLKKEFDKRGVLY